MKKTFFFKENYGDLSRNVRISFSSKINRNFWHKILENVWFFNKVVSHAMLSLVQKKKIVGTKIYSSNWLITFKFKYYEKYFRIYARNRLFSTINELKVLVWRFVNNEEIENSINSMTNRNIMKSLKKFKEHSNFT